MKIEFTEFSLIRHSVVITGNVTNRALPDSEFSVESDLAVQYEDLTICSFLFSFFHFDYQKINWLEFQ